jgi:hypothetical protein
MVNLDIFYDHLVYFTAIGNILWPFGICILLPFGISCCHLVYFSRFGILYHEKSGNPVPIYKSNYENKIKINN